MRVVREALRRWMGPRKVGGRVRVRLEGVVRRREMGREEGVREALYEEERG